MATTVALRSLIGRGERSGYPISGEVVMGAVLRFVSGGRRLPRELHAASRPAEVVIFPGVRIERDTECDPEDGPPEAALDGPGQDGRPRKSS